MAGAGVGVSRRKTNPELVEHFRMLLTEGARWQFAQMGDAEALLAGTKPWRDELWKLMKEVDDRLCPKPTSKG